MEVAKVALCHKLMQKNPPHLHLSNHLSVFTLMILPAVPHPHRRGSLWHNVLRAIETQAEHLREKWTIVLLSEASVALAFWLTVFKVNTS